MSDANGAVACVGQPSDDDHLRSFDKKLQVIRDRVASVALNYHTGCYVVGRPGTGKTFTIKEELDRLDRPGISTTARMTPWGLWDFMSKHPEHVIVLDDITSLFKSQQAMEILLAALDGKPGEVRPVPYRSKDNKADLVIAFTGALIAISNVPLRSDPLARALGSRIVVLEHEPSDDEIAAFIRKLANDGYEDLSSDECIEVAEFVIAETRQFDLRLDLRHLTKAWQDFRQHKHGRSRTTWRDLVRTSLKKFATESIIPFSKKDEIEAQRQKVREALRRYPNDRHAQIEETGLKPATFYVRLKEVRAEAASSAA
jgi:hypothetical protein